MAISSPGIGSSLDVNSIVSQLMALEQRPLTLLGIKEARLQSRLSAIGQVKGALSSIQSGLANLKDASRFSSFKGASSDATVASVTASTFAEPGTYNLDVTQLASAQKLNSQAFATAETVVGGGTLTLQFGSFNGASFTANSEKSAINLTLAADATLASVRDAINGAKAGVTASIVNDGTGFRLAISSSQTGAAFGLKITASDLDGNNTDDAGLSRLVFDPAGTKRLNESQAARDAAFTIDGIAISQAGNTVTNALSGVTLNLIKVGTSTLSVSRDTSAVKSAIDGFVKAYNDGNKVLTQLGAFNAETREAGALQGDSTLRTIRGQMRSLLGGTLPFASGGLRNLSEIGLSFALDGSLTLDASKLQAVLDDPTKDVASLFASVGRPSDPSIRFGSATNAVKPGDYALSVTQLATRGTITASSLLNGVVAAGINDSVGLTVNGSVVNVSLSAGSYSAAGFAAELQSRINGALSGTAASVAVTATGTGGSLAGSAAAPLLIDATNNTIDVTLNGVTHTVTLTQDTYLSASAVAAEIQAKTNAAFAADGFAVAVTEAGGVLTISAANSFGTGSSIAVNGLGADALLGVARTATAGAAGTLSITSTNYGSTSTLAGLSVDASLVTPGSIDTASASGVDAAGTLGGASATGSGQVLNAAGLSVVVTGGATGNRGSVSFDRGFASQLDTLLTSALSSTGLLESRVQGIQSSIDSIGDNRELIERRLVSIEARLRRQFTALDTLIAGLSQTSNFLQQQLATLPGASSGNS
ncbi:MAG TPA: flagellar filament capping protein FliD [Rhodocyclaceae bacterium]